MYNYSIIIPHKNIPELLERCLASIPDRQDIEVIVVDDNSDENKVTGVQRLEQLPPLIPLGISFMTRKEEEPVQHATSVWTMPKANGLCSLMPMTTSMKTLSKS